jgi:hypothetical protein
VIFRFLLAEADCNYTQLEKIVNLFLILFLLFFDPFRTTLEGLPEQPKSFS